jgi:octaprenyl-diphosphate synthase
VLLSAGALGYRGTRHHELAAVVEFIHTATLLHDDVVDESCAAARPQTANAMFGNAASVLVGDFLYSRAFQMMVSVGSMRVMRVLSDATNIIAEGEVLQLMNCHDADVGRGALSAGDPLQDGQAVRGGRPTGGHPRRPAPEIEQAMADYGMHIGTAFPVDRRCARLFGRRGRNRQAPRRRSGRRQADLPLIYVMQHGTAEQAALVRNAIENGGRDDFAAVLAAVRASGARSCAPRGEAEALLAASAISIALPASHTRIRLLELCRTLRLLGASEPRCPFKDVAQPGRSFGRGVAQPGRVLRSGRRSRRFESSRPDHPAELMIRCAFCGVNQPRGECVESGGAVYCSESHRREAEVRAGGG